MKEADTELWDDSGNGTLMQSSGVLMVSRGEREQHQTQSNTQEVLLIDSLSGLSVKLGGLHSPDGQTGKI